MRIGEIDKQFLKSSFTAYSKGVYLFMIRMTKDNNKHKSQIITTLKSMAVFVLSS